MDILSHAQWSMRQQRMRAGSLALVAFRTSSVKDLNSCFAGARACS